MKKTFCRVVKIPFSRLLLYSENIILIEYADRKKILNKKEIRIDKYLIYRVLINLLNRKYGKNCSSIIIAK